MGMHWIESLLAVFFIEVIYSLFYVGLFAEVNGMRG